MILKPKKKEDQCRTVSLLESLGPPSKLGELLFSSIINASNDRLSTVEVSAAEGGFEGSFAIIGNGKKKKTSFNS